MGKTVKMELKVAVATGYNGGRRIDRGETFTAPAELKGKWFKAASEKSEDAEDALSQKSNILSIQAKDLASHLASMTSQDINEAISVEQGSGSPRKSMLKQLRDELANRVGQMGGPDPAAKDPNEKDPIQPAAAPEEDPLG